MTSIIVKDRLAIKQVYFPRWTSKPSQPTKQSRNRHKRPRSDKESSTWADLGRKDDPVNI